jgi:eukaryotic-like serine/threonine-protein kinase
MVGEEPLTGANPGALGGFRLQGLLGSGPVGPVYLGVAPRSPASALRTAALMVVRPELARDKAFTERLRADCEAALRVQGPYAVPVIGADLDSAPAWLASEYIHGPTLAQALARHGPMPSAGARVLLEGVARALESIHATGLPHLALDTSSILVTAHGPRVTGYGLARALDAAALGRSAAISRPPLFLAPEQFMGTDAAAPADVFALGHLAAFAMLGRSPFGSGDALALADRIAQGAPDLEPLPEPLRSIIERCLARDPGERPAPAQIIEFCQEVDAAGAAGAETSARTAPSSGSMAAPVSMPVAGSASVPVAAPLPTPGPGPLPPPPAQQHGRATGVLSGALLSAAVAVAVVLSAVLMVTKTPATANAADRHPATLKHGGRLVTAAPSPPPAIDPCLIGSWTGTADDLVNKIDDSPVTFTSKGPTVRFTADGTLTVDYGRGTDYSASVNGHAWQTVIKGGATMQAMTRGGVMYISSVMADGSWVLTEDGSTDNTGALSINQSPGPYSCSATTLVEYTPDGSDTETFSRDK